jgi:hypothetical protein
VFAGLKSGDGGLRCVHQHRSFGLGELEQQPTFSQQMLKDPSIRVRGHTCWQRTIRPSALSYVPIKIIHW